MAIPRALVSTSPRSLARPSVTAALLPARILPLATSVATVALVGLAAEHLLRGAANRALASFGRGNASRAVRAVVTEITVVERFRRD
jgi:hypothetical protein